MFVRFLSLQSFLRETRQNLLDSMLNVIDWSIVVIGQVGAAKAYDKFCRKLYVTLERQAGNKDPDPSSAETNFDLQGTRYSTVKD